jgi:C-3',4' desaturase CrtD
MAKIVVIGAGIGGATVAALLAKAGHEVTVLEAHIYAGGCAGTFYHQKYRFDAGATLAGGFHEGGPHDVVGKMLGISWNVHSAEPAWQVHLPDHTITRYGNVQAWHEELARHFSNKQLSFFRELEHVSDAVWAFAMRRPAFPMATLADVFQTAKALRVDTLRTLPHLFDTVGTWARSRGVNNQLASTFLDAQLLISAQTTAAHANALFGSVAYDLPRKGVNHVVGGIGSIATRLIEAVRHNGGVVYFRHEVTHLEVHNNRVRAVHTKNGARFECDLCIANLTPWDLSRILGNNAPQSFRNEIRELSSMWGAFTLYLGVVDDVTIDAKKAIYHHQVIGSYDEPMGEGNTVFISSSLPGDTSRAPNGCRAITISTHTRPADWWNLRDKPDGKAEYDERVANYSEKLLCLAERAVPDIRKRIRLQLPGTPITFNFYTRRHLGGVGGFPFTSLLKTRGPQTGINNALLVGDSIFPGQSTAGVTVGALRVADLAHSFFKKGR